MRDDLAARFYELMVITWPEGTPEELVAVVDQIAGYVQAAGGSVLRSNSDSPWGRRRLAYPIRHGSQDVRDGFYTLFHVEVQPDRVVTIERDLKLNERLMRYLVIALPGMPTFPEPAEAEGEGMDPAAARPDAAATVETPPATEATTESPELTAPSAIDETAESRRAGEPVAEADGPDTDDSDDIEPLITEVDGDEPSADTTEEE